MISPTFEGKWMKVVVVVASGLSDNQTSDEQIAEWLQHFHMESEHNRNKHLCTHLTTDHSKWV